MAELQKSDDVSTAAFQTSAEEQIATPEELIAEVRERKRAEQVARGQTEALAKTLDLLAAEPELDSFVGQVLKALTEQLSARFGSFWLYDAEHGGPLLRLDYDHRGLEPAEQPSTLQTSSFQDAPFKRNGGARDMRLTVYDDIATAPLETAYRKELLEKGAKTLLAVPLVSGDDFIGVFTLLDKNPRAYRPEELELAHALAQQAVLAIQLARLAEHRRIAAVLEERNRIAREIHDTLAQAFTAILLQVRVAKRIVEQQPEEAWSLIEHVSELAREGLDEARKSMWDLQPEAMEFRDVASAVTKYVERTAEISPAQIELRIHGKPRELQPSAGMDMVRICQEAVMNAIRHAEAQMIYIDLSYEPDRVVLRIQDNGKGFDIHQQVDGSGFGLMGISQRVERHGGKLSIVSRPRQGTEVSASFQIPAGKES